MADVSDPGGDLSALSARVTELVDPSAFAHPAPSPRLVETHISWVILAGEFVYKIRKPVDFGFLDFSTVERRRADCEAEIRLNRRLCPDLYLDVVDIVERDGDGRWSLSRPGRPVEPAVRMRRLPAAGMLPALLERGAADERLMRRVADRLADFHATAATGSGVDEHGSPASLRANWQENLVQTERFVGRSLSAEAYQTIRAWVERFLDTRAEVLDRRVEQGRVRDGHGDLHANSVCVTPRGLYLFDCIEFNDRFRCGDVASEVAFLAMDLDHLGRADLGYAFVEAYVDRSGDTGLISLLDFYKCYRAFVRGKVLSFELDEPASAASDLERVADEARAYFDLAAAYVGPPAPPMLIVCMGLPASGKTTLARGLAGRLGLIHLSSDVVRKHLAGLRPTEHHLDSFASGLYDASMSRRTYAALRRQAARWLRRGRSVVLDATYGQPLERSAVHRMARRMGAQLRVVVCRADDGVLQARLEARQHDAASVSDARPALWPALRAAFREPVEVPGTIDVDATRPLNAMLDQVMRAVAADGPPAGSTAGVPRAPGRLLAPGARTPPRSMRRVPGTLT